MTCSFADLSSHKIKIQVGEKRFTEVYLLLLNNKKYHFTNKYISVKDEITKETVSS